MDNLFQMIAIRLGELGFYDFLLPWLITSAIIWGLLQKSKIFGESAVAINSVLSLAISFLVWGFLASSGFSIAGPLSHFFTMIAVVIIVISVGLIASSLFYPDFGKNLTDVFKGSGWIVAFLVIVGILFILSGLTSVLTKNLPKFGVGKDIVGLLAGLLFFVVILLVVAGQS